MLYPRLKKNGDIRLITIVPGSTGQVQTKLSVACLNGSQNQIPKYEALSYVWGAPHPRKSILCNDEYITITVNLEAALQQMRHESQIKVIWTDQLCINQDDNDERSKQVAMMGVIYTLAERVVVWTGPSDDDTAMVWNALLELRKLPDFERHEVYDLALKDRSNEALQATSEDDIDRKVLDLQQQLTKQLPNLPDGKDPLWQQVKRFFERPWFSRVWTFQEAVLGRRCVVCCGDFYISWSLLQDACIGMSHGGYDVAADIATQLYNVTSVTDQQRNLARGIHSTLRDLLERNRIRKATEPRDIIYSVRGVLDQKLALSLQVDYKTSLGVVFARATRFCMETEEALTVLGSVEYRWREESKAEMPSWVPDWRFGNSILVDLSMRRDDNSKYFNASKGGLPRLIPDRDERKPVIRGFMVATLSCFYNVRADLSLQNRMGSDRFEEARFDKDKWRAMYRAASSKARYPRSSTTRSEQADYVMPKIWGKSIDDPLTDAETLEMAYRRTISADLLPRPRSRLIESDILKQFPAYVAWRSTGYEGAVPTEVLHEHDYYVTKVMSNREFFLATAGADAYMGIVRGVPRDGDCVCVLFGGDTPFVLRPTKQGEWQFIADAYVHGIMDGEVLETVAEKALEDQEFVIV